MNAKKSGHSNILVITIHTLCSPTIVITNVVSVAYKGAWLKNGSNPRLHGALQVQDICTKFCQID